MLSNGVKVDIALGIEYNLAMIKLESIDLELGGKQVFRNFYFFAGAGDKVLLSAPSGTGKTCFFNIIMGFLRPMGGQVEIGGREVSKDTVADIRKRICYIGQEASLPSGCVEDVLSEIGSYRVNRGKDFSVQRVTALFEAFSLESETRSKNVESLSGGERQRLLFVICLLLDRDIWLLDEITSGLDKDRKQAVMDTVAASEKTVIVASHDPMWKEYGLREAAWQEMR